MNKTKFYTIQNPRISCSWNESRRIPAKNICCVFCRRSVRWSEINFAQYVYVWLCGRFLRQRTSLLDDCVRRPQRALSGSTSWTRFPLHAPQITFQRVFACCWRRSHARKMEISARELEREEKRERNFDVIGEKGIIKTLGQIHSA